MATRSPDNPSNGSLATGNYTHHEPDVGKAFLCFPIVACSLLGNLVILFSYCQNYKMRTMTNTMVINHCLTDILIAMSDIAFFCTPTYIPSLMESDVFCTLSALFDSLFKVASFLSMFCIGLGRHIDLVRGCRRRLTKERVAVLIAWVWLQASLAAAPWNKLSRSGEITSHCASLSTLPLLFEAGSEINALSIFFKTTCIVFPALSIYYISYHVFSSGRKRRRVDVESGLTIRRRFSSKYFNTTRSAPAEITAVLLFGTYIICTMPFLVATVWSMFSKHHVLAPRIAITVFFFFRLKGLLFPIIYVTRNRVILHSVLKFASPFGYNVPDQVKTFSVSGNPGKRDLKPLGKGAAHGNRLNRRLQTARDSRIFCKVKRPSLTFDFTDIKRAKESSYIYRETGM